jgi:HemK-like putative methylase
MKLKEWLDYSANILEKNFLSKSKAYQESNYLAQAVLGQLVERNIQLSLIAQKCLDRALEKRKKHMPLAKIVQNKEFYNKTFITTQDTLDPRPETEAIIDLVSIKPRSILDLGTGTGCLIIILLTKFPKAILNSIGIDISNAALKVAQKNANMHLNQFKKNITFTNGNWANNLKGHFDLIIANPPYITNKENLDDSLEYEPKQALFGNQDTYKEMLASLKNITFLQMLIEIPDNLISDVQTEIENIFPNHELTINTLEGTQISILNIKDATKNKF